MPDTKICFMIAPIGDEGTETRERSDQILEYVVSPVAHACDYRVVRADQISEPGMITAQVIQHIVDDPMVVADLTDWNPNVFYELALRHALRKPTVHLIQSGQKIPFDVAGARTVQVDHRSLPSVEACKKELEKQIRSVEKNPSLVDNPISVSVELQSLRQSDNPLEKSNAEILDLLREIRAGVFDRSTAPNPSEERSALIDALDGIQYLQHEIGYLAFESESDIGMMRARTVENLINERVLPPLDWMARRWGVASRVTRVREASPSPRIIGGKTKKSTKPQQVKEQA
jgi:hypothetical protein